MDSKKDKGRDKPYGKIPSYALDDLCSRFVLNTRPDELNTTNKIFFQLETAYWFYLDFHCVENASLESISMKEFSFELMKHASQLNTYIPDFDKHFDAWKSHKRTIGTYGVIIIDKSMKNVLLVQSYGGKNTWGFPKGKIMSHESPIDCAVREVMEETGFDARPFVDPYEYLEKNFNDQLNRLYLISDIPLDTLFQPKTRREIRDIQWFPLDLLANAKAPDSALKEHVGGNLNLYTVMPYIRPIQRWIGEKQCNHNTSNASKQKKRQRQKQLYQHNQNQEYGQQKKGRSTPKNVVNDRKNSVMYSRDILDENDMQAKQGKRGLTVVQSLFGHTPPRLEAPLTEVDTSSFHSKTLLNFKIDIGPILAELPRKGNYYFPFNKSMK